nr:NADH dehydrogenase subunit 6 [Coleoptera sp. 2 KM-2017]
MFFMMNAWFLSLLLIINNHPLSLGLILMLQTINISMITGMMMFNYWYSYMLFLIMVGGMLVLFLYMTNVASNEKFKFNSMFMYMIIIYMIIILMIKIFMINTPLNNNFMMWNYYYNNNFMFSMSKFFNYPSNLIYLMLIIYLLMTLIAIVKIININYGPLRSFK